MIKDEHRCHSNRRAHKGSGSGFASIACEESKPPLQARTHSFLHKILIFLHLFGASRQRRMAKPQQENAGKRDNAKPAQLCIEPHGFGRFNNS